MNVKIIGQILEGGSRDKVIKLMINELKKNNLVDDGYENAVIQRENEFPTGLPTVPIPIAMPHSDRKNVKKSAIVIAKLVNPVIFNRMDKPSEEIAVKIVILLAIKDDEEQLEIIRQLMSIVQDSQLLVKLSELNSAEELALMLENQMKRANISNEVS